MKVWDIVGGVDNPNFPTNTISLEQGRLRLGQEGQLLALSTSCSATFRQLYAFLSNFQFVEQLSVQNFKFLCLDIRSYAPATSETN